MQPSSPIEYGPRTVAVDARAHHDLHHGVVVALALRQQKTINICFVSASSQERLTATVKNLELRTPASWHATETRAEFQCLHCGFVAMAQFLLWSGHNANVVVAQATTTP